jgi:carbon storage regulator
MLVLSRKRGERILLGEDIVITVVEIDRGKVRLGIQAPRSLAVYREEIAPRDTRGDSVARDSLRSSTGDSVAPRKGKEQASAPDQEDEPTDPAR